MKLKELGEFAFIDRIAPGCDTGDGVHVVRGIGDDAAVVHSPDGVMVITTDLLIERVHFIRGEISPRQLGYKSLAVNLSDIAAMGAAPLDAFVSIAVPPTVSVEELDEFYAGMKALAASSGVNLLGGDTTGSRKDLCINVAVTGTASADHILYRSGARVGDHILVSGTLGDSAGGLVVLQEGPDLPRSTTDALLRAHNEPEVFLEEGLIFAASGAAGAAIDLSDGLASDLGHICRQSGVGAVINVESVPLSEHLIRLCDVTNMDPLSLALCGGEDYRLLVTVDPSRSRELIAQVNDETGWLIHNVGEIVEGEHLSLKQLDGSISTLGQSGWDHFTTPVTPRALEKS